jgi:hypothetical protein
VRDFLKNIFEQLVKKFTIVVDAVLVNPAIGPSPESIESSPYFHIRVLFLWDPISYCSANYAEVSQDVFHWASTIVIL